jgi:hypothetical protein
MSNPIEERLHRLYFGRFGLFEGIRSCQERACIHSTLILIYTMMDVSAFLDLPPNNRHSSGAAFVAWTKRYMQPEDALGVTADDLWIARCGVVHGLMGGRDKASAKSIEGIQKIHYAYGKQPPIPSELLSTMEPPTPRVMIHIDHFVNSLQNATLRFIDDILSDPQKTADVGERLNKTFANLEMRSQLG